jgi:hypothetical protein
MFTDQLIVIRYEILKLETAVLHFVVIIVSKLFYFPQKLTAVFQSEIRVIYWKQIAKELPNIRYAR